MYQPTREQIADLAQAVANIAQGIADFFNDPANEAAYQEWYRQKYGQYDRRGIHHESL